MMFDDQDPRVSPDGPPPGFHYDANGNLVPDDPTSAPSTQLQPGQPGYDANTDPTVAMPPGAVVPPGMHWDPRMANFVPDGPGASNVAPPSGGGGVAAPGAGQFAFAPPTASALPTFGGSTTTIPGAPQFPNIPKFAGPSMQEAMADPGYQFVLDQGNKNLQNWAAARGTLNDSSTAKALSDYGQGAAATQYGNVWDRAYNTYNTNLQSQYLDPWQAQYQTWQAGTVNPTTQNFLTNTASTQHSNDINWQHAFDKWREQFNQGFSLATA